MTSKYLQFVLIGSLAASVWGQAPNPTQSTEPTWTGEMPVFHVTATARATRAINFNHRDGSTSMKLVGTALMPRAVADAKVESKTGATKLDVRFDKLSPAQSHGAAFLTYVMWAVTPDGRPENLGEVMIDGNDARLQAATNLQTFGLIVTAEPYFAVTQPSDVVVMEGEVKEGSTEGTFSMIDAKYELLDHGWYEAVLPAADPALEKQKNDAPLDLKEARHALAIARNVGGDEFASDTMKRARTDLMNAEAFWNSSHDKKRVQTLARNVTQLAEDARIIAVRQHEQIRLAEERAAAEKKVADAASEAEREAQRRAMAELETRQAELRARQAREQAEREAIARAWAEREQAALADARLAAERDLQQAKTELNRVQVEAQQAKQEAAAAKAAREAADAERAELRIRIREQLNKVLETRESARGLIVNVSDVLFDTGKYNLKPGAKEKLAKVAGILQAYPDLKIQVEGHTDSVGSDEYNQTLSDNRARSVREYLVIQGVDANTITAAGFGESRPVASNDSASGRQQNRRVELVVAGESIQQSAVR